MRIVLAILLSYSSLINSFRVNHMNICQKSSSISKIPLPTLSRFVTTKLTASGKDETIKEPAKKETMYAVVQYYNNHRD